jgi:hypothetical protein
VVTAGGVDHTGATVDTLVFPAGTITVAHSKGTGTQTFHPTTAMNSPRPPPAAEPGTHRPAGVQPPATAASLTAHQTHAPR